DVSIGVDYLGTTFPILDNVLYIPGSSLNNDARLYKYDPSNTDGVTLVSSAVQGSEPSFIVPLEMKAVNDKLYFKITNYNGGVHDELWSSKGTTTSTRIVKKFFTAETISYLYDGNDNLYFAKKDKKIGTELWKVFNTPSGDLPALADDIFKGATSSYPNYLTALRGKLFFGATNGVKGNELFMTNDLGATIVKDINTVSTSSSNAGLYSNTLAPVGNNVIFSAFEKVHGIEVYKSNGTENGTILLNDIIPGEAPSNPGNYLVKNNFAYFIAASSDTSNSIFKTSGTTDALQKVVPDYSYYKYYPQGFNVADNAIVFYVLFNYTTYINELWRSDGTAAGTFILSSRLSYSHGLNIINNTAFFVAGDDLHGYELWESDGSAAGTKMVKDINPGTVNSNPAGMFIYKNEIYFAADNGAGASFWKSDGTNAGTIELRQIDPWYSYTVSSSARYYFEVSNNILYFSAINYKNSRGTQLWRTDGTVFGTQALKDISPDADSYYPVPFYFTDVNGTLFFIGDDGVHGTELWKSDGTTRGTVLVKDITPGINASALSNLVSLNGKLFFTSSGALWSSDGTADGTTAVEDAVISDVNVSNIVATSDKLFLSGYTNKYGIELYAGKVDAQSGKFVASQTVNDVMQKTMSFGAVLYPNPAVSNVALQITGNAKNVSISILDMSGKKLWHSSNNNEMLVTLPTGKFPAGSYFVIVTSGSESKTIRLVKQ
ncbi:MAG: ELWxxDGT repeat protein, partial [Panacibacter sp.]